MAVTINSLAAGLAVDSRETRKTVTFDGTAGFGAIGNIAVFNITGVVLIESAYNYCTTDIGNDAGSGAATLSMGTTGSVTFLISATASSAIDTGTIWVNTNPQPQVFVTTSLAVKNIIVTTNVVFAVASSGTKIVNAGVITAYVSWRPLSPDGNLVPA